MTSSTSANVCVNYSFGNLETLLQLEERYQFNKKECVNYRKALNNAAGRTDGEDQMEIEDQNLDWRYRIARWLLKSSDELDLSRETALIALIYCDRFMIAQGIVEKRTYQLASIASLFVACKMFEKTPLKLAKLMRYTQNIFSSQDILLMEGRILKFNQRYMFPITAVALSLMLLNGISGSTVLVNLVIENTQYLIHLSSCDYFFLSQKPSTVAMASIVVAFDQVSDDFRVTEQDSNEFSQCLGRIKASGLQLDSKDTNDCVQRLKTIHERNRLRSREQDDGEQDESQGISSQRARPGRVTPSPTAEMLVKFSGNKRSHDDITR